MAKVKIVVSLIGVLLLVLTLAYFYLGGFNPIKTSLTDCNQINLIGVEFIGTPQDKKIGEHFQMVEEAREDSPLYTIYYKEPEGKRDTLHVFIGYKPKIQEEEIEKPWSYLPISCTQAIVARLEMNRFVMPGPEKTKKAILAFAKEKGLEVEGVFIDKIISSDCVEVWAPIKH
ncbi:hypothetical protein Q4534_18960 [Cyclobacterium sp. 1_MG-2023]|uniref:hypothetical protein n=1 Tax=Cyclobacterium sp. 1_MG-2023 TaxID=3062681 RepID=UPI0026E42C7B|nr:hypothetical protein [Cyclobacterium sp. 1_MG-2023]MDO6439513.1 hypothetical protein [Cyclobacterium sp. 1_MG-2023]